MRRLIVITTPELAPGYRLAGVATVTATSPAETEERLHELIEVGGEQGIIAVHEPYLESLEARLRRRLDESTSPLVVALPAGDSEAGESERHARLLRMLWQAVGYEITFRPEAGSSP